MKALITGSSRGLGFALAGRLLSEGHDVAITSRDRISLEKAMKKLAENGKPGKLIGSVVDFTDHVSVDEFAAYILANWESVDILVNNVGIYQTDRVTDNIEENLRKSIDINLISAVRMGHKILPKMINQKSGFVFNIISIAAVGLRGDSATYSISKFALKAYNDLLREELKPHGIKVIGIYPGPMNTSSWDSDNPLREKMIQVQEMTEIVVNALKMSPNSTIDEIVVNLLQDI